MEQLGRFTFKYRKILLLIWGVTVIGLGWFAQKTPNILKGDGFEMEGSFAEVQSVLEDDFGFASSNLLLLFEKEKGVSGKEFDSFIQDTLSNIENTNSLIGIDSPLEYQEQYKNDVAYAVLSFDKEYSEMTAVLEDLKEEIADGENINVGLTGTAVIAEDMNVASQNDLLKAEKIGLPIALIVLLLAFGGLIAASVPLMIGIISVVSTMGILYFVGNSIQLSIFVLNVVPMIGLALGIDFALLFVNRFKEELKKKNVEESIVTSVMTAGRSIAFSGLCVILGLAGMLFFEIEIFKTVSIAGITVVVISVICALTFLPALLSVIGANINRLTFFKVKNEGVSKWRVFAKFVMKRPVMMSIIGFAILAVGILPISALKLSIPDATSLPNNYESRTAYETYEHEFMGENQSEAILIVETSENLDEQEGIAKIETVVNELEKEKLVSKVDSFFSLSKAKNAHEFYSLTQNEVASEQLKPITESLISGNKTILTVQLNAHQNSDEAKEFARNWQGNIHSTSIKQGGMPKFNQEIYDEIFNKIPYALIAVFASTFLILLWAFRSIMIPLKAILMNVMSLGATFGILVWMFQGGHFGLEQTPSIALMIPVFIFGIVFGLSMDYEVFLISKIQEVYEETKDNDIATLEGLTSTSKIITSAALIMIVITGSFAFTDVIPVKQLGIGIAMSIFIDATLVRMILVPSLMKLMGNFNWWAPKFIKREGTKKVTLGH